MCGIVGIVAHNQSAEIRSVLGRMNDVIVHRGPDDSGEHIAPEVGLAMRRLSIIDLATGHQPMHTEDGVTLVFNGEIYNYVALRDELIARGYSFKTRSDTEVILNLYHAEGCEGFKKLNGMFAVAIHDSRSDELVLVRDQIGIKPLYYLLDSDRLLFGSEIKSILAALSSKPAVNPQAVWDFLSLRYVPPPSTIWKGIFKLEPGHLLRYSLKTRRADIACFWQPNLTPEPFDAGRNYLREFEDQFLAAVQSHIVASDVPVGTFLSGGLDSGAICAASIELGHRNFHTFSIGGEGGGKDDELSLARIVSKKFGTTHHEITMTRQLYFDQLDTVAWHFDEPYGDETGPAVFLLSQCAQQHVKVAMSGEGSDELLLGYNRKSNIDQLARIERFYRPWPAFALKAAAQIFGGKRSNVLSAIAAAGPGAYLKGVASHIAWTLSDEEKSGFWRGSPVRPTYQLVSGWYTLPASVPQLAQAQQADFQTWLVEDLLMKSDKMAMAASLESRVPFLHLPFVEWCQRAPMEVRIGHVDKGAFRSKAVLRDFVAKRLPPEVLNAPKRGFPVPTIRWFGEMLREEGKLAPTSRAIHDWVDFGALEDLVRAGRNGERAALAKLWGITMLDRWFKVYVD
jgi:asparagine synthase (glutamine-hydrolysing)